MSATIRTPSDTLMISTCCLTLLLLLLLTPPASPTAVHDDAYYDYKGKEVKFNSGVPAKMWVHSGTKWCGAGNIAANYNDLGSAFETDKCCRQHDYCKIYVRPNEEKYNYKSSFMYTISHCECDNDFYNCLEASKDAQAKSVQYYFFHGIQMPCISLVPMRACVKRTWWDKMVGGCSEYRVRETAVLMRLPQIRPPSSVGIQAPPSQLKFRTNRK